MQYPVLSLAAMENIVIRDIEAAELPAVTDLYVAADVKQRQISFHEALSPRRRASIADDDRRRRRLEFSYMNERNLPYEKLRGAFANENLCGYVWYGPAERFPDIGEIMELYVTPKSWGKGIGRALFNDAAQTFRTHGFQNLRVMTGMYNIVANPFYRSLGGVQVNDNQEFEIEDAEVKNVHLRRLQQAIYHWNIG